MLTDLKDLKKNKTNKNKKELGILNKSFVTIGKHITFEVYVVHWRETIGLTPAGAGSL